MTAIEIPRAIAAITLEEPVWEATYISEHEKQLYRVGKKVTESSGIMFYECVAEGTDVDHLSNLDHAEEAGITHKEALDKRNTYDAQWPARPILGGYILGLWRQGRLHEYNRGVGGIFDVSDDEDSNLPSYTLWVDSAGAISVRVDNTVVKEADEPVIWHEYILPRGTSAGIRRLKTENGPTVERTVINATQIVSYVKANIATMARLADQLPA